MSADNPRWAENLAKAANQRASEFSAKSEGTRLARAQREQDSQTEQMILQQAGSVLISELYSAARDKAVEINKHLAQGTPRVEALPFDSLRFQIKRFPQAICEIYLETDWSLIVEHPKLASDTVSGEDRYVVQRKDSGFKILSGAAEISQDYLLHKTFKSIMEFDQTDYEF